MATGKTIDRQPARTPALPASYLALIRRFPLRPLQSEAELDRATAVMNSLLDRNKLNAAEGDYFDVLSDLVERFEDKHHPIADVCEDEMLRFLVDQKGVKQTEAAMATGIAESTIFEVLAGKRQLTRTQIEKLARYFHVSAAVFLPEVGNASQPRNHHKHLHMPNRNGNAVQLHCGQSRPRRSPS